MRFETAAPIDFADATSSYSPGDSSLNGEAYDLLKVSVPKDRNNDIADKYFGELAIDDPQLSDMHQMPGSLLPLDQTQDQSETLETTEPLAGMKSSPVTDFLDIVESIPENVTPEEYEEYRSQMEPLIEEQGKIANDAKVAFENNPVLKSFLEQSDGELDKLKAVMGVDFYKQPFNDLITQFPRHLYSNQGDSESIMDDLLKNVSVEQQGPLKDYIAKVLHVGFQNMDKAPEIVIAYEMYKIQSDLQQHMVDILHTLDEDYYQ